MEEKLTKQDFEDGKLLRYFKHVFLTEQTRRALMPVLGALRDTEVIVPVQISVSDADAEKILQLKKGLSFAQTAVTDLSCAWNQRGNEIQLIHSAPFI